MKVMILTAGTRALFWFRMDMMKSLVRAGHQVVAVGSEPESRWADEFAKADVSYRRFDVQRTGTNPLADLATLKSIRALLRQEKPDKLFCFHGKGNIYGCMAAHAEGIQDVYASVEGLGNVLGAPDGTRTVVRGILKAEYRHALRYARKVFFVNVENRDFFLREGLCNSGQAVITDGIGVNLSRFAFSNAPEASSFLMASRLLKSKGTLLYCQAARKLHEANPDIPCVLIGAFGAGEDAVTKAELDPFIASGDIRYDGEIKDVRPYLRECSVFVLPSYYNEGLPKCIMEAMSSGRAIITTQNVGCADMIEQGLNGLLVPTHNANAVAQAMIQLCSDPLRTVEMGRASRSIAENRFDVHVINKQIFDAMGIAWFSLCEEAK